MKEFKQEDIFRNTLKTHPKVRFFTYNGKIYYADTAKDFEILNDFLTATGIPGQIEDC